MLSSWLARLQPEPQSLLRTIHRPRHLHDIIWHGIYATTTAVIPIQHYATTKAAALAKQQRPQLQCNDDIRGIYGTTTAADQRKNFRPRHLRDIVGRGSNATATAAASTKQQRPRLECNIVSHTKYRWPRYLYNIFGRESYATFTTQKSWRRIDSGSYCWAWQ